MKAHSKALVGYNANSASTRTGRRSEYEVVARVTQQLRATAKASKSDYASFASALHKNRQMWNVLAVDVADSGNGLPKSLRARIFYLAEFTRHHTSKVLSENASILPLLEINMAVLRGLKNEGPKN